MTRPGENNPQCDDRPPDFSDPLRATIATADLRRRSVRGATIMLVAQAAKLVLTIGSMAVLARLLIPADFGLLAMVTAITGFVARFRDLGLTTATVQRAEVSHGQLSTLFWINLGFGTLLTLFTVVIAPTIAWVYSEPRLTLIAVALSGVFILSGAAAQHQALLRRQMRFTALASVEAGALLAGIIAALVAALAGAGYWALVLLNLGNAAALASGAWLACRWRPGRPARGTGIRPFLSFGGNLAAAQVVDAAKLGLEQFLVGRFWGAASLGFYSRARVLLFMPLQQLNQPVSSVAIPALSRLQAEADHFRSFYRHSLQIMALLGMPVAVFVFVAAEPLVLTLLGSQWHETIPLVRALAPAALVTSFSMATGWLYISQGQTGRQLRWMLFSSAVFAVGVALGLRWGAVGVAAAVSVVTCGLRLPGILYCFRTMPVAATEIAGVLWRPALAAAAAGAALYALNRVVRVSSGVLTELAIDLFAYSVAYGACWLILPCGRQIIRELFGLLPLLRGAAPASMSAAREPRGRVF
jgi:O-antigen/teichoic acid export membrane protein